MSVLMTYFSNQNQQVSITQTKLDTFEMETKKNLRN